MSILLQFIALHLLVNLPQLVEYSFLSYLFLPSSDLILVFWILLLGMIFPKLFKSRKSTLLVSGLIIIYISTAILNASIQNVWNRPLNIWLDSAQLGNFYQYLSGTYSVLSAVLIGVLILGLIGGAVWVCSGLIRNILAFCNLYFSFRNRTGQLLLVLTIMAPLYSVFQKLPRWTNGAYSSQGVFLPVKIALTESVESGYFEKKAKRDISYWKQQSSKNVVSNEALFAKLESVNVVMILVESYGATLFENREYFEKFKDSLDHFATLANEAGLKTASGFYQSTRFGGGSWMADAALSCGLPVTTDPYYDAVLNSDISCLGRQFSEAGFETYEMRAGVYLPWPKGKFFGYDHSIYNKELNYIGPRYDWGLVPDQYAIQYMYENFLQRAEQSKKPYFAKLVLISSHAPWNLQPPFIRNTGAVTAEGGKVYNDLKDKNAANGKDHPFSSNAYINSISYSLKSISSYLKENTKEPTLYIVLGDHQPLVRITGKEANWNVPVHVLSSDASLLEPFIRSGFSKGIIPSKASRTLKFEEFLPWMISSFSLNPTKSISKK